MGRPIGFGRSEDEKQEERSEIGPIGFARKREYSFSERIERIIDQKFQIQHTVSVVAKEIEEAYNRALKKEDEYIALEGEIKKIKKMKKFKEMLKEAKKYIKEEQEQSEELAAVCRNVGFCEYMIGQKKKGVEDMCLGIMVLLSMGKEETAIKEIGNIVSLASKEKKRYAELVLKKLFEEMIDSQHPNAIIVAGNAVAEFYAQHGMYKEAADVFGGILLLYQTNLSNKYIAEAYTDRILPAFIECKKKTGEDVIPALLVSFDDMLHVATKNIDLVYLERLREIIKMLMAEMENAKPEERKEIIARLEQYMDLFRARKDQYKINEDEFLIYLINQIIKKRRESIQKFE